MISLNHSRLAFSRCFQPGVPRGILLGRAFASSTPSVEGPTSLIFKRPTIQDAKHMPLHYTHMSNVVVTHLAANGDEAAIAERLTREIMQVDQISYVEAEEKLKEVTDACQDSITWHKLPYQIGWMSAWAAALASIPLCFNLTVARDFNKYFVTTEVPPPKDLETWLEVGSWTWQWMEPPLGQVSFFLLALQLARRQMVTTGIKPYTSFVTDMRAKKICALYPAYNSHFIAEYASTVR